MVICITDNLQNFLQKICSKLLLSLHPAWNVAFFLAFQTCQLYHRLNIPQRFSFLLPEHPRQGTRQYRCSGACFGTNSIIFRAKLHLVADAPGWAGWVDQHTHIQSLGHDRGFTRGCLCRLARVHGLQPADRLVPTRWRDRTWCRGYFRAWLFIGHLST